MINIFINLKVIFINLQISKMGIESSGIRIKVGAIVKDENGPAPRLDVGKCNDKDNYQITCWKANFTSSSLPFNYFSNNTPTTT